jgi:hypothetical protein
MDGMSEGDNLIGLGLVTLGLFFDGWLGYEEDKIQVKYNPSALYMMAHTCLLSIPLALICKL